MSDSNRKTSNGAVEQIMRNMTSDMHNADGQYIQLGFTPPPTPQEPWNMPNQLPQTSYISPFNMHASEHSLPFPMDHSYAQQQPQVPFNYMQQSPQLYGQDPFENHANDMGYVYSNHSVQDAMYSPDYKLFMSQKIHNMNVPDHNYLQNQKDLLMQNSSPNHGYIQNQQDGLLNNSPSNRTPLLDNLVGNWAPNTSGTYSPFGNVASFNTSNIFEPNQEMESLSNNIVRQVLEEKGMEIIDDTPNFQFNRDSKKPRMVAEVKPMRPSYSDVLLKSAPQNNIKTNRSEPKEAKQKKDTKKNIKNEKLQKGSTMLNRSNTSNEIKDISSDKNNFTKSSEKILKDNKTNNLNRKWASLDNVTESSNDFKMELNDGKKTKKTLENINKNTLKVNQRKVSGKQEFNDTDSGSGKVDFNNSKSTVRKGSKINGRQRNYDSTFGSNDRPPGKRSQRNRKRENQVAIGFMRQKLKEYLGWWKYIAKFLLWLWHLVFDILSLSIHLSKDMGSNFYSWLIIHWALFLDTTLAIAKRMRVLTWVYEKFKKDREPEKKTGFLHPGLHNNINMPATGDEAMKRLLACKGKDPYSILGVTPTCTDADIKNYYKKQAKLVHPDKNQQPGAEEAFKILVHAFDMIGEPERRAAYDRGVAESAQAEQAMSELTELLVQLQQKVEAAANTIRCSACGLRHRRIKIDRQSYSARNCKSCKIHHSAKEGDIWAEARCWGFLWHYYACMDGGVYDITEWAGCQKDSLKHLKPDSHNVQYRIALGKQPNGGGANGGGPPRKHTTPRPPQANNPDLDNLINSFYGHADGTQQQQPHSMRRKTKKAK